MKEDIKDYLDLIKARKQILLNSISHNILEASKEIQEEVKMYDGIISCMKAIDEAGDGLPKRRKLKGAGGITIARGSNNFLAGENNMLDSLTPTVAKLKLRVKELEEELSMIRLSAGDDYGDDLNKLIPHLKTTIQQQAKEIKEQERVKWDWISATDRFKGEYEDLKSRVTVEGVETELMLLVGYVITFCPSEVQEGMGKIITQVAQAIVNYINKGKVNENNTKD